MLAVVAAGLVTGASPAGAQQTLPCDLGGGSEHSTVSKPPRYDPLPQQVVEIASRVDGATIQIGLLRPDVPAGVRTPVIVDASPYHHDREILNLAACRAFLAENLVPQGYAVARSPRPKDPSP